MQRFRTALLAVGLLLVTTGLAAGVFVERARQDLDNDLRLNAASRVTAVDDFAERARALTLVASHSAAFTSFYRTGGTREQRIRGEVGDPTLMPSVHTALRDVGLIFRDSLAGAGFIDRSGAENAVVVRGHPVDPKNLAPDRTDAPFFDPAFELPYGAVYQSRPYRSEATDEWVISTATKVDAGPGVSPAVVHFELTVEGVRVAMYSVRPGLRVRVVDLLDGRVIIDSTKPQYADRPLGDPEDYSLRWVQTSKDGELRSEAGFRHDVRLAKTSSGIATSWAVVASVQQPTGPWARPTSIGPMSMVFSGLLLLGLSIVGYARHGRSMHRAARTDYLTGLRNRMAAREIAETHLAKQRELAVIVFDLDRFKHVNDTLGHHAGDILLTVIAQRLTELVRHHDDVVARLGGDEFIVLAHGIHDDESVRVLCERLIRTISDSVTVNGVEVSVGVSIGIARAPKHGTDYGTLLQRADIAMYVAKAGRTGWQTYHEGLAPGDGAELLMDAELRRGIAAGQLEVHFQTSFDIVTGAPTRTEALVRWRHPVRGLLMPGHFIPQAESTGAIELVTRDVLRQALDQVVVWKAGGQHIAVAVNVSAQDVIHPGFGDHVIAALTARGLTGSSLVIELTESVLLTDPDVADAVLRRLGAAGVGIAIDDFGAGYASLLYLRRYPVSMLKLDRSLVQGLSSSATDAALVRWTVEMAHSLGVTCVAEGVENAATFEALADLGCDEAQGFYLQAPGPGPEMVLGAFTRQTVPAGPR
ncbi:MAG: bifunctional diguanylate cyclase/phosphodiesterase [Spirochaetaceae bacterium]|nr:bifunctional diguanylate cyclase/phosphodiesterase [Spirochaetaceae bacterium]